MDVIKLMGSKCSSCGMCVGDCPAARFSLDFNPRQIVIRVSRGLREGLVSQESPIWKCTTCYTCQQRCPSGVKPVDVIIELRNHAFEVGCAKEQVPRIYEMVGSTGRSGVVTQTIIRRRKDLGLPPIGGLKTEDNG